MERNGTVFKKGRSQLSSFLGASDEKEIERKYECSSMNNAPFPHPVVRTDHSSPVISQMEDPTGVFNISEGPFSMFQDIFPVFHLILIGDALSIEKVIFSEKTGCHQLL